VATTALHPRPRTRRLSPFLTIYTHPAYRHRIPPVVFLDSLVWDLHPRNSTRQMHPTGLPHRLKHFGESSMWHAQSWRRHDTRWRNISENAVGESRADGASHAKLPPLPSDARGEDPDLKKASGWSALKLWRVDTNTNRSSGPESTTISPTSASETTPQTAQPSNPTPAVPLSRKIGGFFSSRTSVSSATSQSAPPSHRLLHQQEPMYNGSDCSSVDESEPLSPEGGQSHGSIMVRDVTNGSSSSEMGSTLDPAPAKIPVELDAQDESPGVAV